MTLFRALLIVVLSIPSLPVAASSPTLTYVNRSPNAGQHLILRREGARLVIVEGRSGAIVASAPAAETERVIVRGAAGQDDTLTLDLQNPFSLSGGIDYDGGADGWDTLVVSGGSVQKEIVTQLTPHDGVLDLDGLVLRYTNLEPVTDLAAAASLTVMGTAGLDVVTISDGPVAGQATISSPSFESYTFSNKTNVVFDGLGGGDDVTFSNTNTPTGLASFIIQNVHTVGHTAALIYPAFGVSATGTVDLNNHGNHIDNIEIVTQNGDILLSVTRVTIGGVSAALSGLRVVNNGGIEVDTLGNLFLHDTDGPDIIRSGAAGGDVDLLAGLSGSNIQAGLSNGAITAPAGSITVWAGGSILLGSFGANFNNDIRASGFVSLFAVRDILISGLSNVVSDAFGTDTGGDATATVTLGDFLLTDTTGSGASFGSAGAGGGDTFIFANNGSVSITADSSTALHSSSGLVQVRARRLLVDAGSGIAAPLGFVDIRSVTVPFDLGSTTDAAAALELSDAEVDRITTPFLAVGSGPGFDLTVTQPISFAGLLTLLSEGTFSATGAGSLSAPELRLITTGTAGRTWTINASSITVSPGAAIPYSGVARLEVGGGDGGNDTFNVIPSPSAEIHLVGNGPIPPASPGDTLNVNTSSTTSPVLTSVSTANGFNGGYTFGNRAPVTFEEIETIVPDSDLSVTKTSAQASYNPGETITYTIVLTNSGPTDQANVTLTDPLPANTTFSSLTAPGGFACTTPAPGAGGTVSCTAATLPPSSNTFTLVVNVSPSAFGPISNTATVSPTGTDPNLANNDGTLVLAAAAAIPTLSQALLVLLAAALGIAALLALRGV